MIHIVTMSKKLVQAHSQSYLWLKRLQLRKVNQVIKSDAFSLSEMKSSEKYILDTSYLLKIEFTLFLIPSKHGHNNGM